MSCESAASFETLALMVRRPASSFETLAALAPQDEAGPRTTLAPQDEGPHAEERTKVRISKHGFRTPSMSLSSGRPKAGPVGSGTRNDGHNGRNSHRRSPLCFLQ